MQPREELRSRRKRLCLSTATFEDVFYIAWLSGLSNAYRQIDDEVFPRFQAGKEELEKE